MGVSQALEISLSGELERGTVFSTLKTKELKAAGTCINKLSNFILVCCQYNWNYMFQFELTSVC